MQNQQKKWAGNDLTSVKHFILHWRHQGKHGEKQYNLERWARLFARTYDDWCLINLDTGAIIEITPKFVW